MTRPNLDVVPGGRPPVEELLDHQRSWLHLDGAEEHLWFALAVAVSAGLDGDPLWGMVIGPPSGGKTEAVRMCEGVSEHVDELTAPALLSWTQGKNPRPTGVLTRIGERGLVTVADFSTVLAMSNNGYRDQLFALLRRAYDGEVVRDLGNAPGPLRWRGRLTLLAACTPEIDRYSSYADALGPRWLYLRLPEQSTVTKRVTARAARRLADVEARRRQAQRLAGEVIRRAVPRAREIEELPEHLADAIDDVAIVTCYGRGAVPRSGYGRREIEGLAVVEEPPRLTRQLVMLARCLLALGLDEQRTLALVYKASLDSMPQVRARALAELAHGEPLLASELARRIKADRKVARFCLEDLAAIGITECLADEDDEDEDYQQRRKPWVLTEEHADLVVQVMRRAARFRQIWQTPETPEPGEASHARAGSEPEKLPAGTTWDENCVPTPLPPRPEREREDPTQFSSHVPPQVSGHPPGQPGPSGPVEPPGGWDADPVPEPPPGFDDIPPPDTPPFDPYA